MKPETKINTWLGIMLAYLVTSPLYYWIALKNTFFGILSWTFLISVPFVLGAVVGYLGARYRSPGYKMRVLWGMLMVAIIVQLGGLVAMGREAMLCCLVILPIVFVLPTLGMFCGILLDRFVKNQNTVLIVLLGSPFIAGQLEKNHEYPTEIVTITDHLRFDRAVSPSVIWDEIVSVRPIDPGSIPPKWIYQIGFPKPLSAEISHHGVGGVRVARFERDVSFFEVVNEWIPEQKIAFSIKADPAFIPATAFDQHIIIGGRFFDVLDGSYTIHQQDDQIILELTSHHRLTTWSNTYTSLWSKAIMHEIQQSILTVIDERINARQKSLAITELHNR